MEFEFDETKSQLNLNKHGMDFLAAQQLWDDLDRLEVPARSNIEPRFSVTGKIDQKMWSAVITYREGKVRLISVRRARKEEVTAYDRQNN